MPQLLRRHLPNLSLSSVLKFEKKFTQLNITGKNTITSPQVEIKLYNTIKAIQVLTIANYFGLHFFGLRGLVYILCQ